MYTQLMNYCKVSKSKAVYFRCDHHQCWHFEKQTLLHWSAGVSDHMIVKSLHQRSRSLEGLLPDPSTPPLASQRALDQGIFSIIWLWSCCSSTQQYTLPAEGGAGNQHWGANTHQHQHQHQHWYLCFDRKRGWWRSTNSLYEEGGWVYGHCAV